MKTIKKKQTPPTKEAKGAVVKTDDMGVPLTGAMKAWGVMKDKIVSKPSAWREDLRA